METPIKKIYQRKRLITEMYQVSKIVLVTTRAKELGKLLCYFYKIKQNVNTIIFRPFNVFGPGMPKNDYRVFQDFLISLSKKNQSQFLKTENKQELLLCNRCNNCNVTCNYKG